MINPILPSQNEKKIKAKDQDGQGWGKGCSIL